MIRTQGGRLIKRPVKYEPDDSVKFTDDFEEEEYNSDGAESDVSSTVEFSDDDSDSDDSFVCDSDEEIEYDDNDDDEEEDFECSDTESDEEN